MSDFLPNDQVDYDKLAAWAESEDGLSASNNTLPADDLKEDSNLAKAQRLIRRVGRPGLNDGDESASGEPSTTIQVRVSSDLSRRFTLYKTRHNLSTSSAMRRILDEALPSS